AVVVEILIQKFAESAERLLGIKNQVFVMNLEVIRRHGTAVVAAFANHPLPIQSGSLEAARSAVPGKRLKTTHSFQRESDIPAVADDVDEESGGDVGLDLRHEEDVVGVVDGPAIHILVTSDLVHGESNEITAGTAFAQN